MTTKFVFHSDPTCPWCYLGLARFEIARAEFDANIFEVSIAPFFINPDLPVNSMAFDQYLMARFGNQKKIADEFLPLQKGCEEDNIPLALDKIKTIPNTMKAQRLVYWARELGSDLAVFKALQNAHFIKGLDIGNSAVLRAIAEAHDMDGAAVAHMLDGDLNKDNITLEINTATKNGITRAPTSVIGGHYVVDGVQSLNFWRNVIGEIDEKGRKLAKTKLN